MVTSRAGGKKRGYRILARERYKPAIHGPGRKVASRSNKKAGADARLYTRQSLGADIGYFRLERCVSCHRAAKLCGWTGCAAICHARAGCDVGDTNCCLADKNG